MKAIITVTGKDNKGIVAAVSEKCVEYGANIEDISQTIMGGYFVMIILVELDELQKPFPAFVSALESVGEEKGLVIKAMHEDIFNSMHRI